MIATLTPTRDEQIAWRGWDIVATVTIPVELANVATATAQLGEYLSMVDHDGAIVAPDAVTVSVLGNAADVDPARSDLLDDVSAIVAAAGGTVTGIPTITVDRWASRVAAREV